mgnify:CR=1 FL=1
MMYTLCIHNLIYYYSQERALAGVGGIDSLVISISLYHVFVGAIR